MDVRYTPLLEAPSGLLARLLADSYAGLLAQLPSEVGRELLLDWERADAAVHANPQTIGVSGFLTILGTSAIGFATWDPRQWPAIGEIGHNCVLPAQQGQGLGRQQVQRVLARFREVGCRLAVVRTNEHPFFEPARRVYEACGFRESGRESGTLVPPYETVVFKRDLSMCAA